MSDISQLSLTHIVSGIKKKNFTSEEVTKSFINNSEKSKKLNVYITDCFEEALIIDVSGEVLSVLSLFKFSINFIIDVKSLDKLSTFFSFSEILANFDICFTVSLSIDI